MEKQTKVKMVRRKYDESFKTEALRMVTHQAKPAATTSATTTKVPMTNQTKPASLKSSTKSSKY